MITDDGKNDMRGIDYARAEGKLCPRCKTSCEEVHAQRHSCGMMWGSLYDNAGRIIGYIPYNTGE